MRNVWCVSYLYTSADPLSGAAPFGAAWGGLARHEIGGENAAPKTCWRLMKKTYLWITFSF